MTTNTTARPVRIEAATAVVDRKTAFRVRYQVFAEELGQSRYADSQNRRWRDSDDVPPSMTLLACDRDQAVGTMRLLPLWERSGIAYEMYEWQTLADVLQIPVDELRTRTCRLDRAAVLPSHRRIGVYTALLQACYDRARTLGAAVLVTAVELDNVAPLNGLTKRGWKRYGPLQHWQNCQMTNLYVRI